MWEQLPADLWIEMPPRPITSSGDISVGIPEETVSEESVLSYEWPNLVYLIQLECLHPCSRMYLLTASFVVSCVISIGFPQTLQGYVMQ